MCTHGVGCGGRRNQQQPPISAQDQMPNSPAARGPERLGGVDNDPSNVRAPTSRGGNSRAAAPLFQHDTMNGRRVSAPGKTPQGGKAGALSAGGNDRTAHGQGIGAIFKGIIGLLGGGQNGQQGGGGGLGAILQQFMDMI